jgi:cytochrome c556
MATLGKNLSTTLRGLTELFVGMKEGPDKEKVKAQILELSDMIDKLVDENLPERIKEYKDATEALGKANDDITKAKADISKIAEAIDTAAKAISAIAKLLAVLGIV